MQTTRQSRGCERGKIREWQFYAETYDTWMSEWAGEMDFYREIVAEKVKSDNGMILDIACGTGRVGLRLTENGKFVVGLDQSPHMLAIARGKSSGNDRISWVEGDMRSVALDKLFDLVLIPSHSFQNLNAPDDQAACLENIWQHLKPGGLLVIHLDHMSGENMKWHDEISGDKGGIFEEGKSFKHPKTGLLIKPSAAWSYEPATQTAVLQSVCEEIGEDGEPRSR